jgi:hypothetical protein
MSHVPTPALALISWSSIILWAAILVASFSLSIGVISFILVKIPATYFQESHPRAFWVNRHAAIRWTGMILKNLLGVILVLLGILMSIPGVPGQGLLTILLGIILLDFPGKRSLEQKLVSQPMILQKINRLRHKFSKPPLVLD